MPKGKTGKDIDEARSKDSPSRRNPGNPGPDEGEEGAGGSGVYRGLPRNPNIEEAVASFRNLYTGDDDVPEGTIQEIYQAMLIGGVDPSRDEWNSRVNQRMDDEGARGLRVHDIPDAFKAQVSHMMRMMGLSARKWNLILPSVVVSDSEAVQAKLERIAC